MSRLVTENEAALQQAMEKNFKTASQESIFETYWSRFDHSSRRSRKNEQKRVVAMKPT